MIICFFLFFSIQPLSALSGLSSLSGFAEIAAQTAQSELGGHCSISAECSRSGISTQTANSAVSA